MSGATPVLYITQGFDYWATATDGQGLGWTLTSGGVNFGAGRYAPSRSIGYNGGYRFGLNYALPQGQSNQTTLVVGHAYFADSNVYYSTGLVVGVSGTGGTCQVNSLAGTKSIELIDSNGATYAIPNYSFPPANQWTYLEAAFIAGADTSTGSVTIRQDGITIFDAGIPTITAAGDAFSAVIFGSPGSQGSYNVIDDVYIWNGQPLPSVTGTHKFLGPMTVQLLRPTTDISNNGWTLSTGTSVVACIGDPVTQDGTATTINSTANGALATFDCGTLSSAFGAVLAVNPIIIGEGVAASAAVEIISNGATATSNYAQFLSNAQTAFAPGPMFTDPNTDTSWTEASLNAATFTILKGSP